MTVRGRATTEGYEAPFMYRTLDAVIDRYGGREHDETLKVARAEFEERRGRVIEDEPLWEEWTQAFLEWFVVDRPWDGGPSPVRVAHAAATGRERSALAAWIGSQRVLGEVRALQPARVELFDLLGGATFAVTEERALHGVAVGDLVEVRLVGFEGMIRFGRTFVYHPRGSQAALEAHLAAVLAGEAVDRAAVLDELASLRVKVERYRHVDPVRVYEAEVAARAADRKQPSP